VVSSLLSRVASKIIETPSFRSDLIDDHSLLQQFRLYGAQRKDLSHGLHCLAPISAHLCKNKDLNQHDPPCLAIHIRVSARRSVVTLPKPHIYPLQKRLRHLESAAAPTKSPRVLPPSYSSGSGDPVVKDGSEGSNLLIGDRRFQCASRKRLVNFHLPSFFSYSLQTERNGNSVP